MIKPIGAQDNKHNHFIIITIMQLQSCKQSLSTFNFGFCNVIFLFFVFEIRRDFPFDVNHLIQNFLSVHFPLFLDFSGLEDEQHQLENL